MKRKIAYIILFSILMLNIFATYFGRIYFPDNFHPDKVSFLENYLCFSGAVFLFITGVAFIISIIGGFIIIGLKNFIKK